MIHNIRFREFIYEGENEEDLTQAIFNIFPDVEIEREEAEGLTEDKIIILTGIIKKKRYTRNFIDRLVDTNQNIDFDKKMDEKGNLFLRLDKDKAIEDEILIIDSGDSIHLKIKIAAFPAKKEVALKLLNEKFNIS